MILHHKAPRSVYKKIQEGFIMTKREIMIYRSSSFGRIEPLKIHGIWHNFEDPLYIKVTDAGENTIFDGYGSDH